MPLLPARLIDVRMSWNFLPENTRLPSGRTVSSATCRAGQPNESVTSLTASVVEYRHGVHPWVLQYSTKRVVTSANRSGGQIGSPVVMATPPSTR